MSTLNPIVQEDCLTILKLIDLRPFRKKHILITGANGFIGQYLTTLFFLANQEQKLGCKLTCVTLHGPNRFLKKVLKKSETTFKKIDLSKPFTLQGRFDYIFHAAGYGQPAKFIANPLAAIAVNVDATRQLLELAKRSKGVFVFFSSAEVYGELPPNAGSISEEYMGSCSTTNARSVYGESKRLGETLVALFEREHGVRAKILRLSHTYGPGISVHDTRVLGDFMRSAFFDKKITLLSSGHEKKTYGYIADVLAMSIYTTLHYKELVYNVGGIDSVSIRKLAELVAEEIGATVVVPRHIGKRQVVHHPGFVKLELTKVLRGMPGFSFTSLREGLRRTIDWNKAEYHIS